MVSRAPSAPTLRVKDPGAKGNVFYTVPWGRVQRTAGLAALHLKRGAHQHHQHHHHRACLCRLYQEGRCRQGVRCRSLHVDREFVAECRARHKVVLEDVLVTEVVALSLHGVPFAVRYPAVTRTRGLAAFLQQRLSQHTPVRPVPLCPAFNSTEGCAAAAACTLLHVYPSELRVTNEKKLRTPCCQVHGAVGPAAAAAPYGGFDIISDGVVVARVPSDRVAYTDALRNVSALGEEGAAVIGFDLRHVCFKHAASRCKYGRSCRKLHICREVAACVFLEDRMLLSGDSTPDADTPPPLLEGSDAGEDVNDELSS